jgi:hypothetical protein
MNWLEQLAAEWYEYRGFFVRRNDRIGRRSTGGYASELDILALDPRSGELHHIEASGSAASWAELQEQTVRKFNQAFDRYEELVGPNFRTVRRIAILGFSRTTSVDLNWGNDIEVKLAPAFLQEIIAHLASQSPATNAVSEKFPLLRTIQAVVHAQGSNREDR